MTMDVMGRLRQAQAALGRAEKIVEALVGQREELHQQLQGSLQVQWYLINRNEDTPGGGITIDGEVLVSVDGRVSMTYDPEKNEYVFYALYPEPKIVPTDAKVEALL
jgi:hypothetical protein